MVVRCGRRFPAAFCAPAWRRAGERHPPLSPPGRAATRCAGPPLHCGPADAARPL